MHFTQSLLVSAAAVVSVVAQTPLIAFTSIPAVVEAGNQYTLEYSGGNDDEAVTIILRRGDDSRNLEALGIVNGTATGGSAIWRVSPDIENGNNYALQISQGTSGNYTDNYSGRFTVTGGSDGSSSSSSGTPSPTATSTRGPGGVVGGVVQTGLSNANSTTTVAASNATTTIPAGGAFGTGAMGTGATGSAGATGTAMMRNTTMSMATLSSTASETGSAEPTGEDSASSTGAAGSEDSDSGAAMLDATSTLALVLSAFAAVVYLG
ncbi:MAG: hypothetical protein Q9174_004007 [Haloplaca sp. 1 TL-2023]